MSVGWRERLPIIMLIRRAMLMRSISLRKQTGANALITTAKDAVKLKGMAFSLPCYVLEIEIVIDDADAFRECWCFKKSFTKDARSQRCKGGSNISGASESCPTFASLRSLRLW